MGKHEVGTPKWISNKIKSKGLQKLRWYCQMCEKQCRDENGFKCHTMSEAHQRQLLLFGENTGKFLHGYSKDFEKGFNDILRRQYNEKRVHANVVYQQYISDKEHVHMNSTCWVTLTSFVKHLGRCGKADIDETEKGWYITWKMKDQETLDREAKEAKKNKMAKDDEERIKEYIDMQIEKAKDESTLGEELGATELLKAEDETVKLDLKINDFSKVTKKESSSGLKNVFKDVEKEKKEAKKEDTAKRKQISALEEIMEEGKKRKKLEEEKAPKARCWLRKGIVVKVVTKSLGDKYYKKKGYVKDVIDDFAALVVMNDTGAKVKLDQDHLETVIPGEGREVVVLWGQFEGESASLRSVIQDQFKAELRLTSGNHKGDKIKLPYEQFSKKYPAE
jgi:DNA/RNA-binding protein KIN17